jgi:hypothetical protein
MKSYANSFSHRLENRFKRKLFTDKKRINAESQTLDILLISQKKVSKFIFLLKNPT